MPVDLWEKLMSIEDLNPIRVQLSNGAHLSYVRAGKGPVMMLLHGVLGDYRSWDPQWEVLTQHFDCISVSCRYSYPNENTLEAPDHSAIADSEDIALLMRELGVKNAFIVGSSYGGFAALALTVNHPDLVAATLAVEPPMMKYAQMYEDTAPVAAKFHETTVVTSRKAFEEGDDVLGTMLLTGGIRNTDPNSVDPQVMQRRLDNKLAGRRVALSSDEFPLLKPEQLQAIEVPVKLLTGANTAPIFKAIMTGITRAMPQAELQVVAGSSHGVSQEQPQVFNSSVLEFFGALR